MRRLVATGALAVLSVAGSVAVGVGTAHAASVNPVACSVSGTTQTCTYDYTGAAQKWIVPNGVNSASVIAYGASGGAGLNSGFPSGPGGMETATLSGLTPGQVLQVNVGGAGATWDPYDHGAVGGWNGGGSGFTGGGGASDVRAAGSNGQYTLQDRLVVAGGGGGGGAGEPDSSFQTAAGAGGGAVGGTSADGFSTGGTQTAGGVFWNGYPDSETGGPGCYDAGFGVGGSCLIIMYDYGQPYHWSYDGGGGGAGWYGGEDGMWGYWSAGGGGSSHAGSQDGVTATEVSTATGGTFTAPAGTAGNGRIQISYTLPNVLPQGFTAGSGAWTASSGQSFTVVGSNGAASILTMQADGNLVEANPGTGAIIWAAGTAGNPGAAAQFTANGTLQIVSSGGTVLWHAPVSGGTGSTLALATDGTLKITDSAGNARWFTSVTGEFHSLTLAPNTAISVSANNYQFFMQADGNLVWYDTAMHPLWASNTAGHYGQGYHLVFDGTLLMIYDGANNLVWDAGAPGVGWWLDLQGDGNVVIYDYTHTAYWASNTAR